MIVAFPDHTNLLFEARCYQEGPNARVRNLETIRMPLQKSEVYYGVDYM